MWKRRKGMNIHWQARWQALAEQLQQQAAQFDPAADPVSGSLQALTESLLAFGKDQFEFFWDGFQTLGQLLPSMTLPQEHVMRATLDQVAFDLSIIQRISAERNQKELNSTQETADKLAQLALNVATAGDLLPQCAVLTYFNKSANIRIIPYAPIALIGIPFSATKVNCDFLAIPHEVGHFVYHHAPGLAAKLHALIPLYPNWINHWLEEIFADVYAAYVAGPVSGLSLQQILLDNSQEKFVVDDGEHPPDAIRPYGFNHALRHLGETKRADDLDELWQEQLALRHHPHTFVPHNDTTRAELTQAQRLLEQTAAIFVDFLEQQPKMSRLTPWSEDKTATDKLFKSFDTWCNNLNPVERYHLLVEGDSVGIGKPEGTLKNARPKGSTQTWRDWIKAESRANKNVLLPAQAWTPVFTVGHWPVKGPEGNSDGGI
jgi:hypothetical protein